MIPGCHHPSGGARMMIRLAGFRTKRRGTGSGSRRRRKQAQMRAAKPVVWLRNETLLPLAFRNDTGEWPQLKR